MLAREKRMIYLFLDILLIRYNNQDDIDNYIINDELDRVKLQPVITKRINEGFPGNETGEYKECLNTRDSLNSLNYNKAYRKKLFDGLRMTYAPKFILPDTND